VELRLKSHVTDIILNLEVTTEQLDDDINRITDEVNVISLSSSTVYSVTWLENGEEFTEEFDAVILAAPLEFAQINIPGIPLLKPREYRLVHVTLCHGHLNDTYFGTNISHIKTILTTKEVKPWIAFSVLHSFDDGSVVVKFFSVAEIEEQELNRLFTKRYDILKSPVYAYPLLKPNLALPPITLSTNLFYVNSFESFISVMEGSVVSSWNTVRLLEESWSEVE